MREQSWRANPVFCFSLLFSSCGAAVAACSSHTRPATASGQPLFVCSSGFLTLQPLPRKSDGSDGDKRETAEAGRKKGANFEFFSSLHQRASPASFSPHAQRSGVCATATALRRCWLRSRPRRRWQQRKRGEDGKTAFRCVRSSIPLSASLSLFSLIKLLEAGLVGTR